MSRKVDNGGSIAIKGFNYQKASIILIMVNNYKRDEFCVTPEAEDDFQVHVKGQNIFIQVKGEKSITLQKLITKDIIKKNLETGTEEDVRKIFIWDIGKTFLDGLEEESGKIVSPLLKYSDTQRKKIVQDMNLDKDQKKRLENQFLYKTPFSNNLTEAIKHLYGEMIIQELHINSESGRALLGELSLMIDQKSEINFTGSNYSDKEISGEYLKKIFINVEQYEMFNQILDKSPYNTFKKEKIKKERIKILTGYQNIKKSIEGERSSLDLENLTEQELVDNIVEMIKDKETIIIEDNLRIAIAIECLCELWEDEL